MQNQQLRILDKDQGNSLLPTAAKIVSWRPNRLKYLLIAPPKWGKTTFFSGVKRCVLLACEAGYSEVDCPKIVITSWDRSWKERRLGWDEDEDGIVYASAMEVLEEMENHCPYDFAIIDTIDMLTKMAADYYCKLARVEHPSEGGDYGRGWDLLQTTPVRRFYSRIVKLGCGVAAITHSKEKTDPDKFGNVKPKKETSLPGGVQHFIHTQSDCIMHGFFARRRLGQKDRDRYISFDGTDNLMAGTRIRKVYIPNKYIVDPPSRTDDSLPWKQWENFFVDTPNAGMQAEKDFQHLVKGVEDETVEQDSRTNTYVKKETESTTTHKPKGSTIQRRSETSKESERRGRVRR